ncbi:MAG: methyltransferase domain-containing protein [Gammaproteobacteria bacterium]
MATLNEDAESRLQAEAQVLRGMLAPLAGRVAVQIGTCGYDGVPPGRFAETFCLDPSEPKAGIRAHVDALPLMSESVDMVLMMHSMDRAGPRSAWVAEAARVLRPEGHLIVVGSRVWRGEWLRDGVAPLGVWRLRVLTGRHGLSWEYARGLKGAAGVGHGVYVAVVRRRVAGVKRIRPAWEQKKTRRSLEVRGAGRAG